MTSSFPQIIAREREALKAFLAHDIDVPRIPLEVTDKRHRHWTEHGFELHYLPGIAITPETKLPKWKKVIAWNPSFLEELNGPKDGRMNLLKEREELHLYSDALTLPGKWVVVDTRQKPQWKAGGQIFPEDGLIGGTLSALRAHQKLTAHAYDQQSRFDIWL